jgi:hypothetical protein
MDYTMRSLASRKRGISSRSESGKWFIVGQKTEK